MKKFILFIFFFVFSLNNIQSTESNNFQGLAMHGDVSTKWKSEIGGSDFHSFLSEANLECDYTMPGSWVAIKMKAATVNGKESAIFLDKAFLGYQIFDGEKGSFSLEAGRHKMSDLFDSKLQFDSYFNGLHLVYNFYQPNLFHFTLHGGPLVVSSDNKHYAFIGECIWDSIGEMPLTIKYSFTDWNAPRKKSRNEPYWPNDKDYVYRISQMQVSYQVHKIMVYGAYLLNHQISDHNEGYYLGFTTGKIQFKGDIEVDINFQSCKENALSPLDFKGFKKGVQLKACYALLDRMNLEAKFALFDDYNGLNNNRRVEFSAIYTW